MKATGKGSREAAAAATAEEIQKSYHESVANSEEEEEEESTLDSKKSERQITDWIGRPCEPPSRNEYKEAEGKEENVGATKSSTEDNSPIDEYK